MRSILVSANERLAVVTQSNQLAKEHSGSGKSGRWRALIFALIGLVALLTGLSLFGDVHDIRTALRDFDWRFLPIILALTLWNYGWRFIKWNRFLRALNIPEIPGPLNLGVYLSGYSMSITPGKVGELVKAVYIRRINGTPVNRTSAAIAAERITDAIAMLLLALVGLLEFNYGRPLVGIVAFVMLAGIIAIQKTAWLHGLLDWMTRYSRLESPITHARAFVDASNVLYRPRILTKAVGIGVVSWAGECIAFYFVLIGLGIDASWDLLLTATFILAVSSLAGGASMVPGGLGVTDASVAGMLMLLVDDPSMTRAVAAAATLIIRFATLWFAVLIGAVALPLVERQIRRISPNAATPVAGND
jgi:uncharacterized protein (TIRG00374 family)